MELIAKAATDRPHGRDNRRNRVRTRTVQWKSENKLIPIHIPTTVRRRIQNVHTYVPNRRNKQYLYNETL